MGIITEFRKPLRNQERIRSSILSKYRVTVFSQEVETHHTIWTTNQIYAVTIACIERFEFYGAWRIETTHSSHFRAYHDGVLVALTKVEWLNSETVEEF